MMFQRMIKGTEAHVKMNNLRIMGFQPNLGWMARRTLWVRTTFIANKTVTLYDVRAWFLGRI